MKSLIQFILKYQNFLLFLLLELAALLLVVSNNDYHNARYYSWSIATMGNIYEKQSNINDYFALSRVNEELAEQNAILQELLIKGKSPKQPSFLSIEDPLGTTELQIISGKVINASVNKQHNILTLNVGAKDSIEVDMAVIGPLGIVGVVKSVSDHYSLVLPLINQQTRISSKLRSTNYFGTLKWNTNDYRMASLEGFEQHVPVSIGDTIVTSGFGAIYPEGVMVGRISSIENGEEGVFHDIKVELSTDFKRLSYVYLLRNNQSVERRTLEQQITNK